MVSSSLTTRAAAGRFGDRLCRQTRVSLSRDKSLIPMDLPVLPEPTHLTCNSAEFFFFFKTPKKIFLKKGKKNVYSNTSPPGLIWAMGFFLLCGGVKGRQDVRGEHLTRCNRDVWLTSQKHLWPHQGHGLHQVAGNDWPAHLGSCFLLLKQWCLPIPTRAEPLRVRPHGHVSLCRARPVGPLGWGQVGWSRAQGYAQLVRPLLCTRGWAPGPAFQTYTGLSTFGLALLGWQCLPESSAAGGACDPAGGARAGSRVGAESAHCGSCFRQQCRSGTVASADAAWPQGGMAGWPSHRLRATFPDKLLHTSSCRGRGTWLQ